MKTYRPGGDGARRSCLEGETDDEAARKRSAHTKRKPPGVTWRQTSPRAPSLAAGQYENREPYFHCIGSNGSRA
jgi:hypothetical protein